MSIKSTITEMYSNLSNAYSAIEEKGGTISGNKNLANLTEAINSISAGGSSGPEDGKVNIKVIDSYTGKVFVNDYATPGEKYQLPEPVVHDALQFQQWCSPVSVGADNTFTVPRADILIGTTCTTKSGKLEIDAAVTNTSINVGLNSVSLHFTSSSSGTVEWGDGSTANFSSGSSRRNLYHTFTSAGNYTIKVSGSYQLDTSNFDDDEAGIYGYTVIGIRFPEGTTEIPEYLGYNIPRLRMISFPKSLRTINTIDLALPEYIAIPDYASSTGYIGNERTRFIMGIATNVTRPIRYSGDVLVPEDYAGQIGNTSSTIVGITGGRIVFAGDVDFIRAIDYNTFLLEFPNATRVPTLNGTSSQNNLAPDLKIVVPDNLYDSWKSASMWNFYGNNNYIYKASEFYQK